MQFVYPDDFPMRGKYKRYKDRIYFFGDFEDGEKIKFVSTSGKPSSTAAGYAWYQSTERHTPTQQLIRVSEVESVEEYPDEGEPNRCGTCYWYSNVGVETCNREYNQTKSDNTACQFYEQ